MIVGFTGTRYGCTPPQLAALRRYVNELSTHAGDELSVLHGGAEGADAEFDLIVALLWLVTEVYPSHRRPWDSYARRYRLIVHPPAPPLVRNRRIVRDSDSLIACPAEATEQQRGGTWMTVRVARRLGRPVTLIKPDGSIHEDV